MELRVGGKYRLGRKIGSGSFGDIYLGECEEQFIVNPVHTRLINGERIACECLFDRLSRPS